MRWLLPLCCTLMLLVPLATARVRSVRTARPVWQIERLVSPDRVIVRDAGRWLATFTTGARTVLLTGPARFFQEATAAAGVEHGMRVRLLDAPFAGAVDERWLRSALADATPDVLELAMQYVDGAASAYRDALRIAGDADYGPLNADGKRQEGSDFNDYLGVDWMYGAASTDRSEPLQLNSLDCSGFVRMVFGFRGGIPLTLDPDGLRLPRRAVQMAADGPGTMVITDTGAQASDFSKLHPGDLVFFDVSSDDGPAIDHVGIYLGIDGVGRHRFVSSRKTANGPTLGDSGGKSLLDGTGLYAKGFRAARRL